MEFFSQTYIALRGPTGAPQSAPDTIARLADRLAPSTLLADRRAAVLALKGLARTPALRPAVAARTLPPLLDVLENDAPLDADIGRATLETLAFLCSSEGEESAGSEREREREEGAAAGRDTARERAEREAEAARNIDTVLKDARAVHALFVLLSDTGAHLRLATLQLLATLLQARRQVVQGYFLKAQGGPPSVVAVLEDRREIIRHEAIFVVQALISQSAEIQKILAFEGAFERLFHILASEGGLDGGAVVRDALTCVDALLRFNQSNQSYLRATPLPPLLLSVLGYPPELPHEVPPPQGFALQLWDAPQKRANAALVVGIMGLLAKGSVNSQDPLGFVFNRCLLELGLASNAPTAVRTQALLLLPTNLAGLPLAHMYLTPYMPVPDTNGEEWDRLEPMSALDALVELVLHGEYGGMLEGERRPKEGMELRGAALSVFQNFVQSEEIAEAIVEAMVPQAATPAPATPLLLALAAPPLAPPSMRAVTSTHFAALLFAHLLRASPRARTLARAIVPPPAPGATPVAGGNFFVPADGGAPPEPASEPEQEEPQTLLQLLAEHLSLAFLARARADTPELVAREWDRLLVGYLTLLAQWLWEDAGAVREFLEAGALGVLVEPINHTEDADELVPPLCVFLLGVCYEFDREPGEITRSTVHPILTRLGVDALVGRVARLRDDARFKAVGPDVLVQPAPRVHLPPGTGAGADAEEGEVWFDWAFVDFWKSNYYTVQKGLTAEPNALSSAAGYGAESAMLVASLRDVIRSQATELESLRTRVQSLTVAQGPDDREELHTQIASLANELQGAEEKRKEVEKEQEDLLVLLDELNSKRRRDKARMRDAGLEVSDDEEEDDDGEEGGEEE